MIQTERENLKRAAPRTFTEKRMKSSAAREIQDSKRNLLFCIMVSNRRQENDFLS